jgi:hypothetical protein
MVTQDCQDALVCIGFPVRSSVEMVHIPLVEEFDPERADDKRRCRCSEMRALGTRLVWR